jgi:hypothetical protein
MIICAIPDKTVRILRKNLFGRLNKNAAANIPFDMKEYMGEVYSSVHGKVKEESAKHATALSYARLIPRFIQQGIGVPTLASYLAKTGFDFNQALELYDTIKDTPNSLEEIEAFLELNIDPTVDLIPSKKRPKSKKPEAPAVSNKNAVAKIPYKFYGQLRSFNETLKFDQSVAKSSALDLRNPMTPLSNEGYNPDATDRNDIWRESRQNPNNFFYKVQRKLLLQFAERGYSAEDMTIRVEGVPFDVHLTAKPVSSVDAKLFGDDVDMTKDPEGKGVMLFITDSNGDPMRFDINGDPTLDYDSGNIAYYRLKYMKDGPVVPSYRDNKRIDILAEEVYNGDRKAAEEDYKQQMRVAQRMRSFIAEDPKKNMVMTRINGGTVGYAIKDNKNYQNITDVDLGTTNKTFGLTFAREAEPALGMQKGFTYIRGVDGFYGQPLEVERPRVDGVQNGAFKEKLISLLVDDIQDKNGTPYSYKDRQALVDYFIFTSADGIQIGNDDKGTHALKFKGEYLNISTPEGKVAARTLLNTYFSEFAPNRKVDSKPARIIKAKDSYGLADVGKGIEVITPREGKSDIKTYFVIEKPQLHILGTRDNVNYLNSPMPDVSLTTNEDGQVIMTKETKPYSEFIMQNYGLKYAQEEGTKKIRKYDSYFTFQPTEEAMVEMFGEELSNEIEEKMNKSNPMIAEQQVQENRLAALDNISFDIEEVKGNVFGQEYYDASYIDINGKEHYIQKEKRSAVVAKIESLAKKDLAAASKVKETEVVDDLTPDGYLDLGEDNDIIDDANKLNKLDTQKQGNVKATKEQLVAAKEWFNSPDNDLNKFISFEAMFTMINTENPSSIATWEVGGITLFEGSDYSDLYHEAWHAFTQSFLSKQQKKDLYNEARKKSGTFTDHLGKTVSFGRATDLQLEEYLAEDFRTYMLSGGKAKAAAPVRNSIFQKILAALEALFSNSTMREILDNPRSDATIHELYEKLRVGNLAEYTFSQENVQFGNLNKGMQAMAAEKVQHVMSYQNSQLINATVTSLMSEWADMKNSGLSKEQQLELAQMLSDVNDMSISAEIRRTLPAKIKALQTPDTYEFSSAMVTDPNMQLEAYKYAKKRMGQIHNNTLDAAKVEENPIQKAALIKRAKTLNWAYRNFGNTNQLSANQFADGDAITGVIGYHLSKNEEYLSQELLEYFGDIDNMTEEEQESKGRKFEVSGNERSMKEIASKDILFLIQGLHKLDTNGKPILNDLGVNELVSFQEVWNRIARTLENTLDADVMYRKLQEEAKDYPVIDQLLRKLGPINGANNLTQTNLWTNFKNPFSMTRIPLIQLTVNKQTDEDGNLTGYQANAGNAQNTKSKILRTWESALKMRPEDTYTKRDAQGNYLDVAKVLADFSKSTNASIGNRLAGREVAFLRAIGLNVVNNPKVIRELTVPGNNTISYLHSRILTLKMRDIKVRSFQDIYKPYPATYNKDGSVDEKAKPRMKTRMDHVASVHSRYADEGSNFMVSNAEGNTQFEHSLNNSMTVMINAINDAGTYQELIDIPHMAHLDIDENPFAKASIWLNSIFILDSTDPEIYGTKRTITGEAGQAEVKIEFANVSGVLIKEEEKVDKNGKPKKRENTAATVGVASAKADEVTKMILDFHLSTQIGQPEVMRHADKSTSYSAYLKHIYQKNGGTTEKYINNVDFLFEDEDTASGLSSYDTAAYDLLIGHIGAEYSSGQEFTAFHDVLSKAVQKDLINMVSQVEDLETYLTTPDGKIMQAAIRENLADYFSDQVLKVETKFNKNSFVATNLVTELRAAAKTKFDRSVTPSAAKTALLKSFVYNTWINNIETINLLYGDLALYNHAKEEFHKRNAGMGSTGTLYRTDQSFQDFINGMPRMFTEQINGKQKTYDGTFDTAVIKDSNVKSAYYDEYVDIYTKHFIDKDKLSEPKARAKAKQVLSAYTKMTEGDAQGWISFDSYRIMKIAEGTWGKDQDDLYKQIARGETVNPQDVLTFFPTVKAQYFGPLQQNMEGLPITAFHKYSLLPLIPTAIKGSNLEKLHEKMMREGIDYALYESGSKVGTVTEKEGEYDEFYTDGRKEVSDKPFTKNTIFLNYLKNQLEIAPTYKGKVTFPTQLRKLIEDGLMENGVPTDYLPGEDANARIKAWDKLSEERKLKESDRYKLVIRYEGNVRKLTEIAKRKLLDELQWTSTMVKGKEVLDGKMENLVAFVKKQLTREDLADHEIDFLKMKNGKIQDFSLSLSVDKLEKLLNALVVKKLIKQSAKGEGLIQISGAMFENTDTTDRNYTNPTAADLEKYGTNDLPTYRQLYDAKGKALSTTAMKVKIALQGDFLHLLNAKHKDGTRIGDITRLNEMLKDEEWMNEGRNREMITMVGVRIPVQGLNSMEFMEIYEFLPAEAGNIIVPPAEIVAKSGSDFDIDKLTIMMPNLKNGKRGNFDGQSFTKMFNYDEAETKEAYQKYKEYRAAGVVRTNSGNLESTETLEKLNNAFAKLLGVSTYDMNMETVEALVEEGKIMTFDQFRDSLIGAKSVQNDLIGDIKSILELPENFVNLTRPNSTDLFTNDEGTGLAQELGPLVQEYDPKATMQGHSIAKGISPTRVLEIEYNLYKHATNNVGKQTLGLAAVDNTYNSVFNRIGFHLNPTAGMSTKRHTEVKAVLDAKAKKKGRQKLTAAEAKSAKEYITPLEMKQFNNYHRQTLFLPHNTIDVDGEKAISLAHNLDANGEHRVSDVINQLLNGWLDIAKDTWIFNIQGNKEVAPVLLFLLQAGVPYKSAIYFASMPMVREYVNAQRDAKGTFAEPLGKAPLDDDGNVQPFWFRIKAKSNILSTPKYGFGISLEDLKGKKSDLRIKREAINRLDDKILDKDGYISNDAMKKTIVDYSEAVKANEEYVYTDVDRAAFLHFLEAEAMAMPVRDVKLKMNFDTSKSGTLFEAQNRIIGKELLKEDGRFPVEMVDKIIDESPIGSFYVQEFQLDLFKDLFKLRSHPAIIKFLMDKFQNGGRDVDRNVRDTFNGDREKFANAFINDFISHIFQNSIRGFSPNADNYRGYEISQKAYDVKIKLDAAETDAERAPLAKELGSILGLPVKQVTLLRQGAFRPIKKMEDGTFLLGKSLLVDKGQLNKEWEDREFRTAAYNRKGLVKVNANAFKSREEYMNFVYEREILRGTKPYKAIKDSVAYKVAHSKVSSLLKKKEGELQDNYLERINKIAYEMYLRDTALTNTYNHWSLFRSDNSFADQFEVLKDAYGEQAFGGYELVKQLVTGSTGQFSNLKLTDTFLTGDQINVFHENLLELMDPNIKKVDNKVDNDLISDYFRKFTVVAFLQSGMNTNSEFSLTRLVPEQLYMAMVEGPVDDYVKHLDKADDSKKTPPVLERFYPTFVDANSFQNRAGKIRGKDLGNNYTLAQSIAQLGKKEPVKVPPVLVGERLVPVGTTGVYGYGESAINSPEKIQAKTADKKNTFIYNFALENQNAKSKFADSNFYHEGIVNAVGLPTRNTFGEGGAQMVDVDGKIDPKVKTAIDDAITSMKELQADGQRLYFNKEGYGQYMIGYYKPMNKTDVAKQTFLYLSKRLLDEFKFINPGYLGTAEGTITIQSEEFQPISDALVLDFMKHCIR